MGIQGDPTILQAKSPRSFVCSDLDQFEKWLLHHQWIMRRPQNAVERCRFVEQGRALIIAYRGSNVSLTGGHYDETRAELAELLEETTS